MNAAALGCAPSGTSWDGIDMGATGRQGAAPASTRVAQSPYCEARSWRDGRSR